MEVSPQTPERPYPPIGGRTAFDSVRLPVQALVILAALMAIVFPAYMMLCGRERLVSYLSDDAYYYFNVAAQIAAGNGPTADGVTTTTGFHPLYCFALAGIHGLTHPSLDGFIQEAIVFNALTFLAAGAFLYLAARTWWGRPAGIAVLLFWLTNPHSNLISTAGLEGSVYSMTLALLLWRIVVFMRRFGDAAGAGSCLAHAVGLGLCGGLVLLSRTDSLVILPLVAILLVLASPGVRWPVRFIAAAVFAILSVALLGLWWGYSWAYTGRIAQGSAVIKTLWHESKVGSDTLAAGALFTAFVWCKYSYKAFFKAVPLKWTLSALPGLSHSGKGAVLANKALLHLLWIFPLGLGLAYALFIDRPRTWYYVPALTGLLLISAGASQRLLTETPTNRLWRLAVRFAPLMAWLIVVESTAIFARDVFHGRSPEQVRTVAFARELAEEVPPGTRIGCWHSGIVQYYTPELTVINLDGLANNEIVPVLQGEKSMNEYWDERNITLILGEPRTKMGGYAYEWGDRKLEYVREGVQRIVHVSEAENAEARESP